MVTLTHIWSSKKTNTLSEITFIPILSCTLRLCVIVAVMDCGKSGGGDAGRRVHRSRDVCITWYFPWPCSNLAGYACSASWKRFPPAHNLMHTDVYVHLNTNFSANLICFLLLPTNSSHHQIFKFWLFIWNPCSAKNWETPYKFHSKSFGTIFCPVFFSVFLCPLLSTFWFFRPFPSRDSIYWRIIPLMFFIFIFVFFLFFYCFYFYCFLF